MTEALFTTRGSRIIVLIVLRSVTVEKILHVIHLLGRRCWALSITLHLWLWVGTVIGSAGSRILWLEELKAVAVVISRELLRQLTITFDHLNYLCFDFEALLTWWAPRWRHWFRIVAISKLYVQCLTLVPLRALRLPRPWRLRVLLLNHLHWARPVAGWLQNRLQLLLALLSLPLLGRAPLEGHRLNIDRGCWGAESVWIRGACLRRGSTWESCTIQVVMAALCQLQAIIQLRVTLHSLLQQLLVVVLVCRAARHVNCITLAHVLVFCLSKLWIYSRRFVR